MAQFSQTKECQRTSEFQFCLEIAKKNKDGILFEENPDKHYCINKQERFMEDNSDPRNCIALI